MPHQLGDITLCAWRTRQTTSSRSVGLLSLQIQHCLVSLRVLEADSPPSGRVPGHDESVANLCDDGFGLAAAIGEPEPVRLPGQVPGRWRGLCHGKAPVTKAVLPERFTMIESFSSNMGRF
jgi:hypothetical protein